MKFKKAELKNGIRVVSEFHPHSHAVCLGVWVLTGTRDEKPAEAGISHFLEHMVFKGTKTRTAYQIAKSLEQLGGELNAYTTREYTVYYCYVLKDHWKKGLEVLADLVTNMSFSKEDFILEKSVILQEITMGDDELSELIYDIYLEKALGKSTLALPILGTEKSVSAMTQKQVFEYYKKQYSGKNMIVAAAGNIDHSELVEGVSEYLGSKKKRRFQSTRKKPRHRPFKFALEKDVEQLHLLIGLPCTSFRDTYRFEAFIVNTLLGGGMTSKLYQSVREKRGLVYSVYSSLYTFDDFGLINIYAACEPKNMKAVLKNIVSEVKRLKKHGVTDADLNLFKTQVKGSILLGSDDLDNRMTSIGVNEMIFQHYKPVEEVMAEIDQVTIKSVNQFIDKYMHLSEAGWVLMGAEATKQKIHLEELDL